MVVSVDGNRKLSTKVFSCPASNCPYNSSIIWVKAEATNNSSTIHYLWTTYPVPAIVVAYTTLKDVEVEVIWEKLINESSRDSGLKFKPAVDYTFGFAMPKIYEYDDSDDNVDLNDNSYMVVHEFSEKTNWEMDLDASAAQVKFTANDSIIFRFEASSSADRESRLPHLKYTADSNRLSLTLDHITNLTTNSTRFALEINYVVELGEKLDVTVVKQFDDEYTPAVFKTVYGKVGGKHGKAYSQWKPIAYTKADLGRKFQTKASAGGVVSVDRSWNIGEVALNNKYELYGLNLSFGLTKDGFYQKHNYLTWSGVVGYGEPATESLSFLVILIISIGLGLPLAIIIFGGTFVQVRKRWKKSQVNQSYGRIN